MLLKIKTSLFIVSIIFSCPLVVFGQVETDNTSVPEVDWDRGPKPKKKKKLQSFSIKEVDAIPTMKGCEDISNREDRMKCTQVSYMKRATRTIRYKDLILKEHNCSYDEKITLTIKADSAVVGHSGLVKCGGYWLDATDLQLNIDKRPNYWIPGSLNGKDVNTKMNMILPVRLPVPYYITDNYLDSEKELTEDNKNQIFSLVDKMPYPDFSGCEEGYNHTILKMCFLRQLSNYFRSNKKTPLEAKRKRIRGKVLVAITVELDGTVSNPEIIYGLDGGWNEEALRLINQMNKDGIRWIPGQQDGKNVRTRINYTLRFN